jgi:(p)ppGpp synthase/HD superfamily hydrolase
LDQKANQSKSKSEQDACTISPNTVSPHTGPYKEAGEAVKADGNADKKLAWLRQLVDWQQDLKDASEYLEEVKMDLFADEVFVFSPRGRCN